MLMTRENQVLTSYADDSGGGEQQEGGYVTIIPVISNIITIIGIITICITLIILTKTMTSINTIIID